MELSTASFEDGGRIPARYALAEPAEENHVTFAGNYNPELSWTDVPEGTRSFALICHDPDVPGKPDDVNKEDREVPEDVPRIDFFHWVVADLPAELRSIAEGDFASGVVPHGKDDIDGPHGCRQGLNDYTDWFAGDDDMQGKYFGYDGPGPPWNDSVVHRYLFTIYALDVAQAPVSGEFTGQDLREAIEPHVLAEASVEGTYTQNPRLV